MQNTVFKNCFSEIFLKENCMRKIGVFKTETQAKTVGLLKINADHFTAVKFNFPKCGVFNFNQTQIAVIEHAVYKGNFGKPAFIKNAAAENAVIVFTTFQRCFGEIFFGKCFVGNTDHENKLKNIDFKEYFEFLRIKEFRVWMHKNIIEFLD